MQLPVTIYPNKTAIHSRFSVSKSVWITADGLWVDGMPVASGEGQDFDGFTRRLYKLSGMDYLKFFKMDALSKLSILGAQYLIGDGIETKEVAVFLANKHSSWEADLGHCLSIQDRAMYFPSPKIFVYTLPNIAIGEICIRYGFQQNNCFFVMDAPDWAFLSDYADDVLEQTRAKACIIGWVDTRLPKYELAFYLIQS